MGRKSQRDGWKTEEELKNKKRPRDERRDLVEENKVERLEGKRWGRRTFGTEGGKDEEEDGFVEGII